MLRFTVVMPLYNKAPYVHKAVESIVGQTFGDWELWVVDDGSTDGSDEVVKQFCDPRIHLHRQPNTGVGAARNKGVALSGEAASRLPFIAFLDADDWWEPTFLEEMAALIDRHPEAGIYGTGYHIVKNGRRRVAPIGVDEGFAEGEINYFQVYARTLCMPLTSITVCIPREVFESTAGFPEGIKLGEDFLLWASIALHHKVVLLNKALANYNQDVDTAHRGTHHLYPPQEHMLWNLQLVEPKEQNNPDFKQLADNLRTYGLLPYYISKKYHIAARQELARVDWDKQPEKYRKLYMRPVFILRQRQWILKLASRIKQQLICRLATP